MTCLDISVPNHIENIRCKPPYCISDDINANSINHLIQRFGQKHGRGEEEIEKACCLARGSSDIVVMLERPNGKHEYDVSFEDFISNCPTLQAVDDLIRYSSMGARSIHTVTVLDAFPFMHELDSGTPEKRREVNVQCHELIEQILDLKKPKVVICCWQGPHDISTENVILKQLESRGIGSWPIRKKAKNGQMTLIRSFHPAASVCYRTSSYWTRLLLICHFVVAFAELGMPLRHPSWLQDICNKSKEEINNKKQSKEAIESSVWHHLRETLVDPKACRVSYASDTSCTMSDEVNILLRQLFASEYTGSIDHIASLRLIWQEYQHPLKQDVSILLREIERRLKLPIHNGKCVVLTRSIRDIQSAKELESLMKHLQLNATHRRAIVPETHDIFRGLQLLLNEHCNKMNRCEREAARLSSQVDMSIKFGLNIFSPDVTDLSTKIDKLASDRCSQLDETATFISLIPVILEQIFFSMNEVEQSQCYPVDRSRILSIMDQNIRKAQATANITSRAAMRLCGLLTLQTMIGGEGIDGQTPIALQRLFGLTSSVKLLRTGITKMLEFRAMIQISGDKVVASP
ncbi:hypothetical protein BKA67DRAFT_562172 [Truncatella angustata]|uniref:Uncharacterized protein n=1 Tax=Truncatella angustata TaxID=152316 RepID=A0A9P8UPE4_9PEZI|nr:uncharacterized protein BKA67DRAFT_562172 [Truncatella angustata]KAH6655923.1 hypothetical protein BKA67DRAFT_562172 [Truncatella angustata]